MKFCTTINQLHINKILKGFDEGMITGTILIDLKKAFDTIEHDILLQKMSTIGFSNHNGQSVTKYLMNVNQSPY